MMKKFLTIVSCLYAGGAVASTLLMLPWGFSIWECLAFGACWPYIMVRALIYTYFGV